MNKPFDSTEDTTNHINQVRAYLKQSIENIGVRAERHDASKLQSPEKEAFDVIASRLHGLTYGSEEYKASLAELKPALDHHYEHNSHHPEHYPWYCPVCSKSFSGQQAATNEATLGVDGEAHRFCPECCPSSIIWEAELDYAPDKGVNGMTLFDLIEMLCDWKAAGERHANGSIEASLSHNKGRFHISNQLSSILRATAVEMGWIKLKP